VYFFLELNTLNLNVSSSGAHLDNQIGCKLKATRRN